MLMLATRFLLTRFLFVFSFVFCFQLAHLPQSVGYETGEGASRAAQERAQIGPESGPLGSQDVLALPQGRIGVVEQPAGWLDVGRFLLVQPGRPGIWNTSQRSVEIDDAHQLQQGHRERRRWRRRDVFESAQGSARTGQIRQGGRNSPSDVDVSRQEQVGSFHAKQCRFECRNRRKLRSANANANAASAPAQSGRRRN